VFFKHKYITQPTITPADAIVNAYNKLRQTIQGLQHSKDDAHLEALERIKNIMQPTSKHAIKLAVSVKLPRVEQVKLTPHVPRVSFDTTPPADSNPLARLIVASPTGQSIQPKPTSILKPPKFIEELIAARVQARHLQMSTANPVPNESIADRVARRRREAAHSVLNHETGQLLEYRQLLKNPKFKEIWTRSAVDEFGRLAQGIGGRIKGTATICFIHKQKIPADRLKDLTHIKFVCNVRTKKKDPNRTRVTMGGNLINYPEDVGTPTANLLLIKIFLNSIISMRGAKFAGVDLTNFYLMTPLKRPEYAKIKLSDIPEEAIKEYNLHQYATPDNGYTSKSAEACMAYFKPDHSATICWNNN